MPRTNAVLVVIAGSSTAVAGSDEQARTLAVASAAWRVIRANLALLSVVYM